MHVYIATYLRIGCYLFKQLCDITRYTKFDEM